MNKATFFKAILLLYALLVSQSSFARNNHKQKCKLGVYKTADDFRNDRMIEGEKIGFGVRFASGDMEDVLKLNTSDTVRASVRFPGGSAFAYRDKDCSLYRYYKSGDFVKVLYTDGIYLYSTTTGKYRYTYYFYSKDMYAPILRLTRKNLIIEYGYSASFVEKIKGLKSDAQLIKRDKKNGKYKVVNLFNDSIK